MSRALVPLMLTIVVGCGKEHAASNPLAPSPPVSQPPQQQSLVGYVGDTAFRAVAGAKVEILDGPQAGTSITSAANGTFSMNGNFSTPVTLRASKDGYLTVSKTTETSVPGGRPWVNFQLEVVAEPVTLSGEYTLTFAADSSCSELPTELRTRSYAATLAPQTNAFARPDTFYALTAHNASFIQGYSTVTAAVAGDYASFMVYQGGESFGLVEEIAPQTFLGFYGESHISVGTPPAPTISVAFSGIVDYCAQKPGSSWNDGCSVSPPIAHVRCRSTNHRLTLTRR